MTAGKPGSQSRVRELDGVRAIAIWAVLIHHGLAASTVIETGRAHGPALAFWQIVSHGWLGVDLFFVLSGFLITGILLDTRERPDYYREFYRRRALRILPIFLLMLGIMFAIDRGPLPYFGLALLFGANVAQPIGIASAVGVGPIWSLAVEEQFYLIWPTIVRFFTSRRLVLVAASLVVLPATLRFIFSHEELLSITPLRCDGLAFGALAALAVRSARFEGSRVLSVAAGAAAASVALMLLEAGLRSAAFTYAVRVTQADLLFFAGILSAYGLQETRWTAGLRAPLLKLFADTSYCAYLIHLPLLIGVARLGIVKTASPVLHTASIAAIALCATFVIATLSRRYVELPFMRMKLQAARSSSVAASRIARSTV
jgi:peptidoglycan/LPS O-acetylase OafA/YrhL